MGARGFEYHVKNRLPRDPLLLPVSQPKRGLPVKDESGEILYYANEERAAWLIEKGLVRAVGTKNRTTALVALRGQSESLRKLRPRIGERYSHNYEDSDNPRGVWTFKKLPNVKYEYSKATA
jgi:hypothetical protein